MVGYHPEDNMNPTLKLIAGCVSGMTTRFFTQPLDLLKLRVQLEKRTGRNIVRTAKKIAKEEGITAFWHGHNLGQLHAVIAYAAQFYVYELTTKFTARNIENKNYIPYANFVCGIMAGVASATVVNPFEVIRVRQMILKAQYRGIINGARQVYKTGGILAFYGGLAASLLQMGPAVGLSFGTFTFLQPIVLKAIGGNDKYYNGSAGGRSQAFDLAVASAIAGCAAGFVSKTLTYPFDLVKRRLQIGTHVAERGLAAPSTTRHLFKCRNLSECFWKTVAKEGVYGLFRGWRVTVMKAQITNIVAFTSYEMACYVIRELQNVQSQV